ncbi:PREDICTED: uncharacterized protein LOC105565937 [Vollenhovia emeryi]|uniref:uncharacterized protein LOC105565937 n=1 Tax=Vollenhovia emeryi TaxID=411798 RepID=UPI0005F43277|nr:PREDICTED: uncharacterized protein LOC105565937 [Vollenhovia emeryi]XP_011874938.1 PREDICTED: uncharacterized protein LOC105565937 [Vollenhovia emeryi]
MEDNSVIDPEAPDVTPDSLPKWYNQNLYKEAQKYYLRNISSVLAATTIGIIVVFSVATIRKILEHTKRSSSTHMALKRYIETALHLHNLYTCDSTDINSKWYKSMNVIRWYHKMGSKKAKIAGIGEITQRDMVLTQFAFLGYFFLFSEHFGVCNTLEEDEALNHFWRVNGYMLGIPDRFNLCRKNAKETIELCEKVKDLYRTYLRDAPREFHDITTYSIDGVWYVSPIIDKDAIISYTYELHDLEYKKLGWYSWLNRKHYECIFYLCLVPYVRVIMKIYGYCLVKLVLWTSQNFPLLAWMKFGRDKVKLNLYPKYSNQQ